MVRERGSRSNVGRLIASPRCGLADFWVDAETYETNIRFGCGWWRDVADVQKLQISEFASLTLAHL